MDNQDTLSQQREAGFELLPKFDAAGLITAIVTDSSTKDVLMVAHMNEEALEATLETGFAHFWSRSRQELWKKGATSGNIQEVVEMRIDCDQDAIVMKVKAAGPACHTGQVSCFYRKLDGKALVKVTP